MSGIKIKHNEAGFTLLEMLLTVAVLSTTLLLITRLFEDTARSALYERNAVYVNEVMNASVDMIDTMTGFNTIYALLQTPATPAEMEVPLTSDPLNAGVNPHNITIQDGAAAQNIFPSPMLANTRLSEISPLGTRMTVLFFILDDPTSAADERTLGVMVAGLDPVAESDLRAAASSLGAGGGFISSVAENAGVCLPVGCAATIRSVHNAWRIDATTFSGMRFRTQIDGTPASAANGGYIVSFRFFSESEIAGDYLYRLPQLSSPELNSMRSDIQMAGNNLVGVDNITFSQDWILSGRTNLHVKGSIFAEGRLNIEGGEAIIDGDAEIGQLNVGATYTDTGLNLPSRNLVQVEDRFLATDVTTASDWVADTGSINGSLLAPAVRSNQTVVNDLDATASPGIFSTATETNGLAVNGLARAGSVTSTGGDINVASGNTGVLEAAAQGNAVFNTTTNADNVRLNNVDINLLEQCLDGC